jgi:hypothetical protein
MPSLVEEPRIVDAFTAMPLDAAKQSLIDFIALTLNLNASQKAEISPDATAPADDPKRVILDRVAASLDAKRARLLKEEARIPSGVLITANDAQGTLREHSVIGLLEFLRNEGKEAVFIERVGQAASIRDYLTGIGDGTKLEALAATLLRKIHSTCHATRRSFDQGVDCLAHEPILPIDSWCSEAEIKKTEHRLHIVASCKANEGNTPGGIPVTITPAHVRELIGAWLIQRSESGLWQKAAGIKLLSPMQLLLVTTYRLSDDSMQLCRNLGVAVWGIPELIYLICQHAPNAVFSGPANALVVAEIENWMVAADVVRL